MAPQLIIFFLFLVVNSVFWCEYNLVYSWIITIQPRSQGLLRFQDGGWALLRHLESGVDPGNEVV